MKTDMQSIVDFIIREETVKEEMAIKASKKKNKNKKIGGE